MRLPLRALTVAAAGCVAIGGALVPAVQADGNGNGYGNSGSGNSGNGNAYGNGSAPAVSVPVLSNPTADGVTMQLTLNNGGLLTSYVVEARAVGSDTWLRSSTLAVAGISTLTLRLQKLAPATTYDVRLTATNALGAATTVVQRFTTLAAAVTDPVVAPVTDALQPLLPDTGTPAATATPGASATPTPGTGTVSTTVAATPEPVVGKSVVVGVDTGTVRYKVRGQDFQTVSADTPIPVGALVDATQGRVELSSKLTDGTVQTGRFSGGQFRVRQSTEAGGMTQLFLAGALDCGPAPATAAHAAGKSRKRRSLWGSDKGGNFQTNGRQSAATVRGTRWLTRDTCKGTLVRVVRGAVDVREKATGKTIRLRAGEQRLTRTP